MKTDYSVDTVGKFCPVPIIEASNKIKEMTSGETLTVISDDEGIKNDMPNWCSLTGNEFLGMSENNGEISVYIRKAVT
ncbi:MAG: sulfurtransferase TusA family protein [Candidatus Latescibacteria bacterium]|nr:sulfurtransferase TusA family protein [Candidatus Latescibacterota bacterium]